MSNCCSSGLEFSNILDKALRKEKISREEGLRLLEAQGSEINRLVNVADELRKDIIGDEVTYVINRNVNFTNICENSCKFCAFNVDENSSDAYTLGYEDILEKTREALERGATEICFQGGLNPSLSFDDYLNYLEAVRSVSEDIHIHGYSPEEIDYMAKKTDMELGEVIQKLKDTGLDSVPGTAAELLVDRIRKQICPGKISSSRWMDIVKTCHRLGVPTTATMLYGHIERKSDIITHLSKIREIQEETGGFTEMIPLAFASEGTLLGEEEDISQLDLSMDLKVHAVCRIFLVNQIENIQTSWVKLGLQRAKKTLEAGANDFSGTLMEEKITRAAGGSREGLEEEKIRELIKETGRTPKQRNTTYDILSHPNRTVSMRVS